MVEVTGIEPVSIEKLLKGSYTLVPYFSLISLLSQGQDKKETSLVFCPSCPSDREQEVSPFSCILNAQQAKAYKDVDRFVKRRKLQLLQLLYFVRF